MSNLIISAFNIYVGNSQIKGTLKIYLDIYLHIIHKTILYPRLIQLKKFIFNFPTTLSNANFVDVYRFQLDYVHF